MRPHVRPVSATVVVAWLLLTSLVPLVPAQPDYPPEAETVLGTFDEGSSSVRVAFPGEGEWNSTAVELSNHAVVHRATVNLTMGPNEDLTSAPWDPTLDAGDDGSVEWAFQSSVGGAVGLQERFSDGEDTVRLTHTGASRDIHVTLPEGAVVREARMDIVGHPIPHWLDRYNLTPETDSPGESSPVMEVYEDDLWAIWSSSDANITTDGDADIVVRTFDDDEWGPWVELSEPGDLYSDGSSNLIVFDGDLYAIWRRGDSMATSGGHNEVVYRVYDGSTWSPAQLISGPMSKGINTFVDVEVFRDRLYVVWKTTDPDVATIEPNDRDVDMVVRSFDGSTWSPIEELTYTNNTMEDWSITIKAHGNRLWVAWDTWEPNITRTYRSKDVVVRSFDGTDWTPLQDLSPASDPTIAFYENKDALPELATYRNPVTGELELICYWVRGDSMVNEWGDGQDVVYRRLVDGEWQPMETLSEPPEGDPIDQMFPDLFEYNGLLYAIWVLGTNVTVYEEGNYTRLSVYGDILLRTFDGLGWGPVIELTETGNGFDNASYPTLCACEGVLWAGWKQTLATANETISWEVVVRPFAPEPVRALLAIDRSVGLEWGWAAISEGFTTATFDAGLLTQVLAGMFAVDRDVYGNGYLQVPIVVHLDAPALVVLRNLTVVYDYTVEVEFTTTTNGAVVPMRRNDHVDTPVRIPFAMTTERAGDMTLHDPWVGFHLDYPPLLVEPVPAFEVEEDGTGRVLADMEDHFWDDWDDGRLRFAIEGRRGPRDALDAIKVSLAGSQLSVAAPPRDWCGDPDVNGSGEIEVMVRAMDNSDFQYSNLSNWFVVRVTPVNDPPTLDAVPERMLEIDLEHTEQLLGDDIDDPPESLRYSTDSDLVEVDAVTGVLRFTPRAFMDHSLVFNATVTDPHGASATREVTFDFRVVRMEVNSSDWFPYALILLVLLVLALVVGERLRRRRRMTEEELIWDEEAAHVERAGRRWDGNTGGR